MKVLNRALKLCGKVEVIDSVKCTVLERNTSDYITRLTAASVSLTSARFAIGCVLVHETTGHVYVNQGSVASPTWNDIGAVAASEISLAEGNLMIGNSSGVATALNAKTDTRIIVGNGTTATSVAVSGDATMANNGALTIASGAVSVLKLATALQPSHVVKYAGLRSFGGGGVTDAFTVTGVAATDIVVINLATSTNACTVRCVPTTNTLTFTYSADPGASTTCYYEVLRAIA